MEATSTRSPHDPVRQQFLRHLHWYLGQITNEMIQEAGENYDRKKRNDKFFNSLKFLADYVVKFNDGQEKGRETPAAVPRPSATGIHTGLRTFIPNSSLHTQQQQQQQSIAAEGRPQISVPPQQSELAGLSHASLPRDRSFSEAQVLPAVHNSLVGNTNRSSVSPTSAFEAAFSSMHSLQGSRVQSSESVPTVGSISPSQPPSNANTIRNNMNTSINQKNVPSAQQSKPTTNFGFVAPPRMTPASVTPLQKAAISTTAEIEASLAVVNDFLVPPRDTTASQHTAAMAIRPPSSRPTSITGLNATDASDNNASQGRKRKRQKKQWCTICNDHKEGFRGPHELARHINIQHQTKKTVFIVYDDSPGGDMFKNCKHCSRRKIYGQDYNAACHLRRAHFNKRLKTDTPEEREFKQLHPDFPPMEELRPWLRKCLVDVSKLKDGKYIDNQDEAILKVEPAVKAEDLTSSDQDKDQEMTDDEPLQPVGPATPPPDSEVESEAIRPSMNDPMTHDNFFDFDFSEFRFQQPDFIFNSPPLAQPSAVPRTNNLNTIFARQMQSMGISPDQILSEKVPDFMGIESNMFAPFGLPEFPNNNVEALGIEGSFEDFDIDQFLQGP
ncbi:hypothetical protein AOL_s00007g131 [Orbilia oligospora ATCC 24927]|uniref:DUF7896 domain-containing protein n=1 Tax=Arthrobotrys oligospora (strain ATCC 24927 / CBS 115.81 / DSM 1491) TaxID=756982 RepID=G1X1H2_ARTOA|nr:hypothetical protein AOL_s00007g131 [Orbilia oligospora ATCC 24927]EGX52795.1 hypothetical protein AOL_s00007g131 [Orbilia oligospora ATCC 24927]